MLVIVVLIAVGSSIRTEQVNSNNIQRVESSRQERIQQLETVLKRLEKEVVDRTVANCESSNEVRASLLGVFNGLRADSEQRRPGEGDAEYADRLQRSIQGYDALNKALAGRDCNTIGANATPPPTTR